MEKPEIPAGETNGSRHSVWETLKNMGCDLRRYNFCCSIMFIMFMHKISPEVGGGGGGGQMVSTHDLHWPHQSPDRLP